MKNKTMKRLFVLMLSVLLLGGTGFAQKKRTSKTESSATAPAASKGSDADGSNSKLKRDGTPDKRFKENKQAEQPTQKLKKDGTPDMRYKENKTQKK